MVAAPAATHVERATAYAEGIADGSTVACKWVRLACERFLRDLARQDDPEWPYRFDLVKAERICRFAELMPHVKGEWANRHETIKIEPWQAFILANVFGWVRKDTGYRRFREAYIEVPRKNAKSSLSSIVGLFMEAVDGEEGAGIYSAATTRDQARITFDDARAMVLKSPEFRERYGIVVGQHAISIPSRNSTWKPITRESSANEGLNVHFGLLDELHAHKSRDVYGVIRQGMGSRTQPLLWMITTAGSDQAGVCYEQRTGVTRVLERVADLDGLFGIIYTLDEDDDPFDPAVWPKSNPNLGVSVYQADMEEASAKAQLLAGERAEYLTKRHNVWVHAEDPWFDAQAWMDCARPDLAASAPEIPEEFDGQRCLIGIDFASRLDIAAMVAVFPQPEGRFAVFGRYYLPEDTVREARNAAYRGWVTDGWITTTPGHTTDYDYIRADFIQWFERFEVVECPYDPHEGRQFATEMENDHGAPMVTFTQSWSTFNEPMKEAAALMVERKFDHNGDPVLAWAVSNVVAHTGRWGDVMPSKETKEAKIDPAVAMLMALGRAIVQGPVSSGWVIR